MDVWLICVLVALSRALALPPSPHAIVARTWGYNYDRTSTGPESDGGKDVTLKELFDVMGPDTALVKLLADFTAMHALNGTAVRLFVNLPDVIIPPLAINHSFVGLLVQVCDIAGAVGIKVISIQKYITLAPKIRIPNSKQSKGGLDGRGVRTRGSGCSVAGHE